MAMLPIRKITKSSKGVTGEIAGEVSAMESSDTLRKTVRRLRRTAASSYAVHLNLGGGGTLEISTPEAAFSKEPNLVYDVHSIDEFKRQLTKKKLRLFAVAESDVDALVTLDDWEAVEQEEAWDPFAEGRKMINLLKEAEGGAYDRNRAAGMLGLTTQALHARVVKQQVVAWKDPAGRYCFPRWQFSADGLLPGVRECLDELTGQDQWAIMRFFLTESEQLQGKRPLDVLRNGNLEEVIALARSQSIEV
jgi:hypothetical protein